MQKKSARRVLSAVLACALCLVCLPLFALPAAASPGLPLEVTYAAGVGSTTADGRYTTAFSDNLCRLDTANMTLTYRGGWTIGTLCGATYTAFTYVNSTDKLWLTLDTTSQWDSPAGTVNRSNLQISPAAKGDVAYAVALTYRAEKSGEIGISLDGYDLSTTAIGDGFAVFCNGKMVFPTENGPFGDVGDITGWYPLTDDRGDLFVALAALRLTVTAGDEIAFACKRLAGNSKYHTYYPRVTYLSESGGGEAGGGEGDTSVNLPFSFYPGSADFPHLRGNYGNYTLLSAGGGQFSIGSVPRDASRGYEPFGRMSTRYGILNRGGGYDGDQWSYGGVYLDNTNGRIITANEYSTAYAFTAPYRGRVRIGLNGINPKTSSSGADILFCVCLNDRMIWPTDGGSFSDNAAWYNLTAPGADVVSAMRGAPSLSDVSVRLGDRITFCLTAATGNSMSTNGMNVTVTYTALSPSMPAPGDVGSSLTDAFPRLAIGADGTGSVLAYPGPWRYESRPAGGGRYTTLTALQNGDRLPLGQEEDAGYLAVRRNNLDTAVLSPGRTRDAVIAYTAPYSGTASFSQECFAYAGDDQPLTYTVLRGDEVLFTRTGTVDVLRSATGEFTVTAGDTVRFILSRPSGSSGTVACSLLPRVTYLSLSDTVAVTGAEMDPTAGLAIRFFVAAARAAGSGEQDGLLIFRGDGTDFSYKSATLRLSRDQVVPEGMAYVYTGLGAKELGDVFWVRPYRRSGGEVILGSVIRFSAAEWLQAQYGQNDALNTCLTELFYYGAAAQEYFGYRTDCPVTDTLTDAQRAFHQKNGCLMESVYERKPLSATQKPCDSRITGVALLLCGDLSLRVYTDITKAEAGLAYIEVADTPDMKDATLYSVGQTAGTTTLTVGARNFGRTLYLRLRIGSGAGARYGAVITYSVESYAAAMVGHTDSDWPLLLLCEAVLRYGRAAMLV